MTGLLTFDKLTLSSDDGSQDDLHALQETAHRDLLPAITTAEGLPSIAL